MLLFSMMAMPKTRILMRGWHSFRARSKQAMCVVLAQLNESEMVLNNTKAHTFTLNNKRPTQYYSLHMDECPQ